MIRAGIADLAQHVALAQDTRTDTGAAGQQGRASEPHASTLTQDELHGQSGWNALGKM